MMSPELCATIATAELRVSSRILLWNNSERLTPFLCAEESFYGAFPDVLKERRRTSRQYGEEVEQEVDLAAKEEEAGGRRLSADVPP